MKTAMTMGILAAVTCASAAIAQPATLDIDETQSTLDLEITLDTPLGIRTDDDITPISGMITIELDDYDTPTSVTLIDYNISSNTLFYVFDFGILGSVLAGTTGVTISTPTGFTPVSGPIDASGAFSVANVSNEVAGVVDIEATGALSALFNTTTIDLATLAQQPITVSGTLDVDSGVITVDIGFPIAGSGTDQDTGVTVTFSGSADVIATGPVPEDDCLADVNHDGFVTPADFTAWIAAFNAGAPECDQNGDTMCTPADFTAWIANYNAGCP